MQQAEGRRLQWGTAASLLPRRSGLLGLLLSNNKGTGTPSTVLPLQIAGSSLWHFAI